MSVIGFPLLLISLAICNIIVFLMPGVLLTEPVLTLTLMSGVPWPVTLGDTLLALGIVLLLFEIIKGVRPGGKYLTDHLLSLVVFGGAAAEFVMLPQFGSSTYFMLTLLALVDLLSGFVLRARRPARRSPDRCKEWQRPKRVNRASIRHLHPWRHRFRRLPTLQRSLPNRSRRMSRRSFMARLPEPNGIRTFRVLASSRAAKRRCLPISPAASAG